MDSEVTIYYGAMFAVCNYRQPGCQLPVAGCQLPVITLYFQWFNFCDNYTLTATS